MKSGNGKKKLCFLANWLSTKMSPAEESLIVIAQTSNKTFDMANKNLIVKYLYLCLCILICMKKETSYEETFTRNPKHTILYMWCIQEAYHQHTKPIIMTL